MIMRSIIVLLIIKSYECCMNSFCEDCHIFIQHKKVKQVCLTCYPNYVLSDQGQCTINKTILVSLSVTAFFTIIASLCIRHILVLRSLRRKKVYTAEYQQQLLQFLKQKNPPQATQHPYVAYTQRGLQTIRQEQFEQDYIQKCDSCLIIQPTFLKIDAFTICRHSFHCRCLRKQFHEQFQANRHQIAGYCPTCDARIDYLSLYCQVCHSSSRQIQISQKNSLYSLNSFICFRCKGKQLALKRNEQQKMCCGLGKYFCCHCISDIL